jgi:hypothetical protein
VVGRDRWHPVPMNQSIIAESARSGQEICSHSGIGPVSNCSYSYIYKHRPMFRNCVKRPIFAVSKTADACFAGNCHESGTALFRWLPRMRTGFYPSAGGAGRGEPSLAGGTYQDRRSGRRLSDRFVGSPSIRLDGRDANVWPRTDYGFGRRIYQEGDRLSGIPPKRMIRSALHGKFGDAPALPVASTHRCCSCEPERSR